jgi:hypothetical protein
MRTKSLLFFFFLSAFLTAGVARATRGQIIPLQHKAETAEKVRNQLRGLSTSPEQALFFWRDRSLRKPAVKEAIRTLVRYAKDQSELTGYAHNVLLKDGHPYHKLLITTRGNLRYNIAGYSLEPIETPIARSIDAKAIVDEIMRKAEIVRNGGDVQTIFAE